MDFGLAAALTVSTDPAADSHTGKAKLHLQSGRARVTAMRVFSNSKLIGADRILLLIKAGAANAPFGAAANGNSDAPHPLRDRSHFVAVPTHAF